MANKIFKGLKFPGMDDYYILPEAVITKNEDGIIEIESCLTGTTEIENLDASLTKAGYAADAKAVGEALSAKAPAGYGLGGETTDFGTMHIDNISGTGWYWGNNGLPEGFGNSPIHHIERNASYAVQIAYSLTNVSHWGNVCVRREKTGGAWQPWEWVNPPMNPGVEYRTTERYNGKPVYTKYINFGVLPNTVGQIKEVAIADDMVQVISFGAIQYSNGDVLYAFPLDTKSVLVQTYDGILYTEGQANIGYNTASFLLKYIYP